MKTEKVKYQTVNYQTVKYQVQVRLQNQVNQRKKFQFETPSKIIPGAPTTEQPVEIEINQKPNGDAVVTPKKEDGNPYPSGTKVEIPGEDKDGNPITITVTIGDNGSGEVPNDKLPKKDIPGKGKVTEPNKNPSQPVDVTTPARKTPTLDVNKILRQVM